ncbi:hypothetical protein [Hoeflea sp.]|nr:hypothetical protein [Hoeflea sp.]
MADIGSLLKGSTGLMQCIWSRDPAGGCGAGVLIGSGEVYARGL